MSNESMAVQKLWNYCNVLRDDGVSYGDYVEQLTYLLFLKMDDEQTKPPFNRLSKIPKNLNWESLLKKDGDELEVHYRHILGSLGKEKGMIGVIFRKAQNKIQDPAKLKRLVMLIEGEETWMGMGIDVKGAIYEGLLQKNAEDTKSGAGQYFTPRALIKSMVKVIRPKPGETICDPACGTGGFLLASHDLISKYPLDVEQKQFLREGTFHGWDIVDSVVRLCTMNLYLHGIGGEESPIITDDALASDPGNRFDIVLTNPPFGKKSSITIVNGEGKIEKESLTYQRNDFWATTSNKQLNFLQHVKTLLKINGRAAIVVPDNVLFEGGAGETVRKRLLQQCEVHTLLRLPTGIFYAQGVKANVLFFDKRPASEKPWTEKLWIYDLRTNLHFTLKTNTLQYEDLKDFIKCYNPENRHERKETDRFKAFTYEDIMKRDKTNLDIFWLKDESLGDSENLPNPKILALEIAEDLESALEEFKRIYEVLEE
ncbi:MAG: N-6 DNA Methylase [Candidatus Methanofastidiosum methylothiophilum]|uniref:site-specific DNA-methyltransferase (adenine-specific) n=1 Tax=Candidatus Methanofastidiosum methylothiophilum TaxID=1705564 RepID=A0A150JDB7_9EURY|nr:MAG: N-6 DNA Methylase [Candidatus Methanofastidiosum methylthiophilus]KYC56495.1 MAG: N-6 DNA Methylase [Candidatus Methanofastidiosum methylthiophilus]KYC57087.1 MAG: N-6 DNA Methylase [Candidatus Methanofastidiosum methylthiophilus]HNV94363.1 class I SAM-dependent DNA methyltransferase [Methanofastidiosum sp.]HPU90752.1 class I SAM-dependent DNA methyltransferase [Methanofastidiosum sp.]